MSITDFVNFVNLIQELEMCYVSELCESRDSAATGPVKRELPANSGAMRNQGRCELTEQQVLRVLARVCGYMRGQREHYLPMGRPLDSEQVAAMRPFFSPTLLAGVKVVQLEGRRITEPAFCQEARALGFEGLPEFSHMASVTFEDVLVFNEKITERLLFHALVPSVQFQVLGMERYMELFVRAILETRWRFSVPLEAHIFELTSKFAADRKKPFSVEDEIRMRVRQHRYELFQLPRPTLKPNGAHGSR
jgi:hypothetical protein